MNLRNFTPILGLATGVFVLGSLSSTQAAPLSVGSGQFNISGAAYVTNSELLFGLKQAPPNGDQLAAALLPTDGAYSGLHVMDQIHIGNLLSPALGGVVTPGTPFVLPNWIQLGNAVNINVDLTDIPVLTNVPVCAGSAAENSFGNTCRSSAASPIILEQGVSGVTAFLSLMGQAHYAGSNLNTPIVGLLSANFTFGADRTISGLLADLATNGFIMTGYSGEFTTTAGPTGVPEPSSLCMLGLGLLGATFARRKRPRRG